MTTSFNGSSYVNITRFDVTYSKFFKRGRQKNFEYVTSNRVMLTYELPLNEVVMDFYDKLKSVSRGYASLDYHLAGTWVSPMVKLDLMVAGEPVDALSLITHRDFAYERGKIL